MSNLDLPCCISNPLCGYRRQIFCYFSAAFSLFQNKNVFTQINAFPLFNEYKQLPVSPVFAIVPPSNFSYLLMCCIQNWEPCSQQKSSTVGGVCVMHLTNSVLLCPVWVNTCFSCRKLLCVFDLVQLTIPSLIPSPLFPCSHIFPMLFRELVIPVQVYGFVLAFVELHIVLLRLIVVEIILNTWG